MGLWRSCHDLWQDRQVEDADIRVVLSQIKPDGRDILRKALIGTRTTVTAPRTAARECFRFECKALNGSLGKSLVYVRR